MEGCGALGLGPGLYCGCLTWHIALWQPSAWNRVSSFHLIALLSGVARRGASFLQVASTCHLYSPFCSTFIFPLLLGVLTSHVYLVASCPDAVSPSLQESDPTSCASRFPSLCASVSQAHASCQVWASARVPPASSWFLPSFSHATALFRVIPFWLRKIHELVVLALEEASRVVSENMVFLQVILAVSAARLQDSVLSWA